MQNLKTKSKKMAETNERRCSSYKTLTYECRDEKTFESTACSCKAKSRRASQRLWENRIISNALVFESDDEETLEGSIGYKVKIQRDLRDHKPQKGSANTLISKNKDVIVIYLGKKTDGKIQKRDIDKDKATGKTAKRKRKKNKHQFKYIIYRHQTKAQKCLEFHNTIHSICSPYNSSQLSNPNEVWKRDENKKRTMKKPFLYLNSFTAGVGRKYNNSCNSKTIFRCICCYLTTFRSYVKVHIIETHKSVKFMKCKFCSFKVTNETCLLKHMEGHAIKRLSCEFCGDVRFFPEVSYFQLNKINSDPTHCQCEDRNFKGKCKQILAGNKESHSNTVKRITCGLYDHAYFTAAKLNHQETRRKFECIFCNNNFTTDNKLRKHVSQLHGDDLPFEYTHHHFRSAAVDQKKHSKIYSNRNTIHFRSKQRKCDNRCLKNLRNDNITRTFKCAFCGIRIDDNNTYFSDHAKIHEGQSYDYSSSYEHLKILLGC